MSDRERTFREPNFATKALTRLEIKLTCNWVAIGFHCWRKGHDWRDQRPTRYVTLRVCAHCGKYRGASVEATERAACRWYRGPSA